MKRLHWLGALTASAMLFSAAASADDHRDRRNWDRNDHHSDRWNRGDHSRGRDGRWDRGDHWRGRDGRWDRGDHWRGRDGRRDHRRYHHSPPSRYWAPPGHRYGHGYRRGYWDNRYHGGHYYRGRGDYYAPHYRRTSLDAAVVLSFPIY
ncbi:MAG TPA: hypothetical protein VJ764_04555 [Steroidobacteraceae bacterium]|nr:hypothetical protein [Steroidobacteraceae bacterium]